MRMFTGFEPIGSIVGRLVQPLPELDITEAWRQHGIRPPAPHVIDACRRAAPDVVILRVVNTLARERKLGNYTADPEALLTLLGIFASAGRTA
jgi:hypothetical protein